MTLWPFSGPAFWPKLLFSSSTLPLNAVTNVESAFATAEALWETVTVLVPAFSRFTVIPGAMVTLRECIDVPEFWNAPSKLTFALGKDVSGQCKYADLTKSGLTFTVKPGGETRISAFRLWRSGSVAP